jgi:type VI secretion system protein ImpJ
MLRVASPDTIEAVLRSYTRALPVEPVVQPPAGLPADGNAGFFELQRRGPFWDAIQDAGQVSVFVPDEFAGAELELLGIPA